METALTADGKSQAAREYGPLAVCAVVIAGAFLVTLAAADTRGATFGQIEATAGGDVPREAAVAVLPASDDAEYLHDPLYRAAREAVENALRARGMRVSDSGPLTLRITIHQPLFGADDRMPGGGRYRQDRQPRSDVPEVTDQLKLPLQQPEHRAPATLSLALLLSDATGKALWAANASASGRIGDREPLVRRLGTAAVADIGASVRRSFLLDCHPTPGEDRNLCLD